jgi:hypothetical protein
MASPDPLRVTTAWFTAPHDKPWYDLHHENLLHIRLDSGAELELEISNATRETMTNSFMTVIRNDIAAALSDPEFMAFVGENHPAIRRLAERMKKRVRDAGGDVA